MLEIECGSGTYVRSLGRDLAESLGTAAVMSALVRTHIGDFRLDEAIDPKSLTGENWPSFLRPALCAVACLPRVELSEAEAIRVRNGLTVARELDCGGQAPGGKAEEIAAVDGAGRLVAILARRGPGQLGPVRNFA